MENLEHKPHTNVRRRIYWKIKFILFAIIIVGLFVFLYDFGGSSKWRAVFLDNNQVYFGHFKWKPFRSTIKLTDIYYLQANQPLQQGASGLQEVSLVKLGDELHGPRDKMVISKEHIIFWEDLKDDSIVVQNIEGGN